MFHSGYVAILGAPNAGKSTLLNTILKEKLSIVSDKPNTTRRNFIGIHTTKDCQMIFLDTPGVHQSTKKLNQSMIHQIYGAIGDADILCLLIPLDTPLSEDIVELTERIKKDFSEKKILVVVNKADLEIEEHKVKRENLATLFKGMPNCVISGKTGEGVEQLLTQLELMLPIGPPYYPADQLSASHIRDIAAEVVREKIMELMYEEIPYATTVTIESFNEEPDIVSIRASIIVEHDSQKGMVIGKGGKKIRAIGIQARADLERMVGRQVFLDLRVKVDPRWTQNQARLSSYGYTQKK
ncbi:MAG: GTPase Era [Deltaproteobacteria bacterium RIFCSPLOWO2_12_FULL_40_28]|nr:MAG: GTPase Era [Deltaproteobacteria bacterium RIFCSPHIGHO2_02_FULL_40_28]OGQ20590.1 MAG: GTPase Era [Deltaproteobacteria bacterium RIFCSPHIGHO2_12_FULL_40_32]OGQ41145.1 MAG: GTPase Era [Deltaproteobacteria bacterium RIFCSPLOWO2_02_FULL_40_36]OGQ55167.1 MAG: GTPase Era [Deltaproteobacteria bacterium RIFCSPLOWO2_12_FULL_40_28]